jgi:hypothetical protein
MHPIAQTVDVADGVEESLPETLESTLGVTGRPLNLGDSLIVLAHLADGCFSLLLQALGLATEFLELSPKTL